MVYLDTSALLKLYIREEGSVEVQDLISNQFDPLPIWEIQEMEFINALNLKIFWRDITAKEADQQQELFEERKRRGLYFMPEIARSELMGIFRRLTRDTPKLGCRTMDILHVACAIQLEVDTFVSFDDRQIKLAKKAGLEIAQL